ncbi:MAG: ABC transporter substrate-binding protein [Frankia sp.]|nr:ABC transporter substrate-binding protein [Frankia sp.]
MPPPVDRRTVLRRGAGLAVLGAAAPTLLAACGDDDSDTGSAPAGGGGLGDISVRLSYTPGVAFAGTYIAVSDKLYEQAGFGEVTLIPGGPSATPSPTDVGTGKAFLGVASTPDQVAAARLNNGAKVKIVGALYQKNSYAVTSLADAPITTPADLVGRRIGVQAVNTTVWEAFLTSAGIDPGDVNVVPVQFDPTPLTTGEVDGWFSYATNEPIALALKGFEVETMLLADHGYPLVAQVYLARDDTISDERDRLRAALKAEIAGWVTQVTNPARGVDLTLNTYARDAGLDPELVTKVAEVQNTLILTSDTKESGLLTISDELIETNLATLAAGGSKIEAADLFDLSLLDEIYRESPELISDLPAVPAS